MDFLHSIWKFISRFISGISTPPMITMATTARDFGWIKSSTEKIIISAWKIAKGILDMVIGVTDISGRYNKMLQQQI